MALVARLLDKGGEMVAKAAAAREVRRVRAKALRNLKDGPHALHRPLELPDANLLKGENIPASLTMDISAKP